MRRELLVANSIEALGEPERLRAAVAVIVRVISPVEENELFADDNAVDECEELGQLDGLLLGVRDVQLEKEADAERVTEADRES